MSLVCDSLIEIQTRGIFAWPWEEVSLDLLAWIVQSMQAVSVCGSQVSPPGENTL
uniref:Uncharacterized protein n=1 Tax=Anguilla anguilla TaxID=7936 RepID=A0A0E9UZ85_ANGAN